MFNKMVLQKQKNGVSAYSLLLSVVLFFGSFAPHTPAYLQLGRAVQTERLAETHQQKKSVSFLSYNCDSKNGFGITPLPFTRVETLVALANLIHNRFIDSFRTCSAFESIQMRFVYTAYLRSASADLS
jgi:hypothetical protein